jgi:hypothetical protein
MRIIHQIDHHLDSDLSLPIIFWCQQWRLSLCETEFTGNKCGTGFAVFPVGAKQGAKSQQVGAWDAEVGPRSGR